MLNKLFNNVPQPNIELMPTLSRQVECLLLTFYISQKYSGVLLTAADGDGQQCNAAPACTASIELETKGSLEISALTKIIFLKRNENKASGQNTNLQDIYETL